MVVATQQSHGRAWLGSYLDRWSYVALLWGKDATTGEKVLEAVVVAHVDDLLFAGSPVGKKSLDDVGAELGFGSLEEGAFTWCGKHIRRAADGTIRISMKEYHENLQEKLANFELYLEACNGLWHS